MDDIEPAQREWALLIVFRTGGALSFCIDYHNLNAVLQNMYPNPCLDKGIDSLPGVRAIAALDASSKYWQV